MPNYQTLTTELLRRDTFRMDCLKAARQLQLRDYYVAAGFLRNAIWDHLHNVPTSTPLDDLDLVYFDDSDLSMEPEQQLSMRLNQLQPDVPWQVRNQARMHLMHGHAPYQNTAEAISLWIEIQTCVGVRLEQDDSFSFCAAYGLEQNWSLDVQLNPQNPKAELFAKRIQQKDWLKLWPKLRLPG
ncbi:nucleotidyltransferase family protein [Rheinheimera sediminis]|uniref:nucleotidyltransferase family protein n=1 Tax=Rheinheimera sp. YQF-1 TaxID=2499626 RepID=UPI001C939AEA|nr:nucleotidyltransferase family protein [Rheinheimera sp. YQF-1]